MVERLGRRGKYLVWELEDDVFLLMHLRMTGHAAARPAAARRRTRACGFGLGEHRLAFVDPRRFGTGELALGPEALDAFFAARLGLEPLERVHRRAPARAARASRARRSRRSCSTRSASPASGTSTPTRRCSARASTRCARPTGSRATQTAALRDAVVDVAAGRDRRQGRDDRRLPRPLRRQRELPGPVPRAPARGRAVPGLRHARCASCAPPAAGPTSASAASRGRGGGRGQPRRRARSRRPARSALTSSW